MSTTNSRWLPKHPVAAPTGAASGPTVAEALADRDIVLVRIRCRADRGARDRHELAAFTAAYRYVRFHDNDHAADQQARTDLAATLIAAWPDVDWSRDHQIHIPTGTVTAAPAVEQDGGIPEDDRCFGGTAPVLLTHAAAGALTDRSAA